MTMNELRAAFTAQVQELVTDLESVAAPEDQPAEVKLLIRTARRTLDDPDDQDLPPMRLAA